MKKLLSLVVLFVFAFSLVACVNTQAAKTENKTQGSKQTATTQTTTTTERTYSPRPTVENEIDEIDLYDSGEYTITFWHIWGASKSAFLDEMVEEFKQYMKDVYLIDLTINAISQSNYGTLLEKTNKAIAAGDKDAIPNLVIGYPDHFAGYLKSLALVDLDPYIDSLNYGVDRNDFIRAYMEENNQFNNITYSLPLTKSQEVMVYNKSALDACGITIPYDKPLTWNEVFAMWPTLKDYKGNYAQFNYLLNYDSTDNMFINFARQLNAGYTTNKGELKVTEQSTINMLTWVQTQMKNKFLSVPLNYSDTASYGSDYFQQQFMPFTVGSTAGVTYDIPTSTTWSEETQSGVRYIFEAGIGMVPQFDQAGTSRSVVQQGPNICMLNAGTEEEDLISWLFIKYLTDMNQYAPDDADADEDGFVSGQDNSARFAIGTGYFPVTYKAYESDLYKEYMDVAKRYFENGYSTEGLNLTAEQQAKLILSEVAYVAYLQSDWLRYDPAFAATSKLYGSATIRTNAGSCIEKIAKDTTYSPKLALEELQSQCTIG